MVDMRKIIKFIVALGIFIAIDLVWFVVVMRYEYAKIIVKYRGELILLLPPWQAAFMAWVLVVFGIFYFVLPHVTSLREAALRGAVYGFVLYGVYDFTNKALFEAWPFSAVVLDLGWGVFINAFISALAFYIRF